ncbi:hypothetical protein [Sorangium sp. So ce394]|uniref:hypothetical protein n=1 Tax=Sorangium sp. So ce394 TaxID=3133310 RepID=UPI003F5C41C3
MPIPEDILEHLSERARRVLAFEPDQHDPRSPDELRILLEARGLPVYDAVLAAQRELGGVRSRILTINPADTLDADAAKPQPTPDGELAIPIGSSTHDPDAVVEYLMDSAGRIYRPSFLPNGKPAPQCVPTAGSLLVALEQLALIAEVQPLRQGALCVTAHVRAGDAIAERLSAEIVEEASDELHHFWLRGGLLVAEGDPHTAGRDNLTRIFAPSVEDAALVVDVLVTLAPRPAAAIEAGWMDVEERVERSRPAEPRIPSASLTARFDDPTEQGSLWAERGTQAGTTIHLIRKVGGALAARTTFSTRGFVRQIFADPPSWLDALLSERAVRVFERAGARRDPSLMTDRNDLVRRLRALQLPISKEILEMEEAIGGLVVKDYVYGIFAQMKRGVGVARTYQGTSLVLFSDRHRYIDASGQIYLTDDIALGGIIADSWQVYLEREALAMLDFESARRVHSLRLNARWGERLAEAFGATALPECSDSRERCWRSLDVWLTEKEEALDFWLAGTWIESFSLDPLVDALKLAASADPPILVCYSRAREAPARPQAPHGPPIAVAPRCGQHSLTLLGELAACGEPGRYDLVER